MPRNCLGFVGDSSVTLVAVLALSVLCPVSWAQPCVPFWTGTGTSSRVGYGPGHYALAVYDDGAGEKLYAIGHLFDNAPSWQNVARWDGREWEVLDAGIPSGTTAIFDIRVLDDGSGRRLYLGTAQGTANSFLYWTGQSWAEVDPNFWSRLSRPLYSFNDGAGAIVYGTQHVGIPGNPSLYVTKWIGSEWQQIGGRFNSAVRTMAVFDSGEGLQLHVLGDFTSIGGVPIRRIARWDGSTWHGLGPGLDPGGLPASMVVFDDGQGPQLYVAHVSGVAGTSAEWVARWDGQQWSAIPGGIGTGPNQLGVVRRLAVFDDGFGPALYVLGQFTHAGGVPVRNVARWDGTGPGGWSALGPGLGSALDMTVWDDGRGPSLFFGGIFHDAGGAPARGVVQWVGCHDQCYADCNNDQTLNIDDWLCFIDKFAIDDPYADCNQDGVRDIQDFVCFINRFAENCR